MTHQEYITNEYVSLISQLLAGEPEIRMEWDLCVAAKLIDNTFESVLHYHDLEPELAVKLEDIIGVDILSIVNWVSRVRSKCKHGLLRAYLSVIDSKTMDILLTSSTLDDFKWNYSKIVCCKRDSRHNTINSKNSKFSHTSAILMLPLNNGNESITFKPLSTLKSAGYSASIYLDYDGDKSDIIAAIISTSVITFEGTEVQWVNDFGNLTITHNNGRLELSQPSELDVTLITSMAMRTANHPRLLIKIFKEGKRSQFAPLTADKLHALVGANCYILNS